MWDQGEVLGWTGHLGYGLPRLWKVLLQQGWPVVSASALRPVCLPAAYLTQFCQECRAWGLSVLLGELLPCLGRGSHV